MTLPNARRVGWPRYLKAAMSTAAWEEAYRRYLESAEWKVQRREALLRAEGRCALCGSSSLLQVHHVTYKRVGREQPYDLRVLCTDCHKKLHTTPTALRPDIPMDRTSRKHLELRALAAAQNVPEPRQKLGGIRRPKAG